jgi:cytochrome c peroxidase
MIFIGPVLTVILLVTSCKKDPANPDPDGEVWDPTPYELTIPQGFPDMVIPAGNPMTIEGVHLGRMLFYDPILSADNTQSCSSCHNQAFAFTDNGERFSEGVDGVLGTRNAMAIINAGWMPDFNWDGSATGLENQAFEPVTNPVEMHETWPGAMEKLKNHPEYTDLFFDAFGTREFDSTHVVKALAQFERTIISSNSKWDRYLRGEVQLSQAETRGFEIFFTEKGDCFHCHSTILFTDNVYHNNGLDSVFIDFGSYNVTKDPNDIGKFKTPTLRNVEFSAPYMHDGRFATLEEVIDFYSHGVKFSPTIDPLMKQVDQGGMQFTQEEKESLIAFLKTLTDTTFVNNPEFSNPFGDD